MIRKEPLWAKKSKQTSTLTLWETLRRFQFSNPFSFFLSFFLISLSSWYSRVEIAFFLTRLYNEICTHRARHVTRCCYYLRTFDLDFTSSVFLSAKDHRFHTNVRSTSCLSGPAITNSANWHAIWNIQVNKYFLVGQAGLIFSVSGSNEIRVVFQKELCASIYVHVCSSKSMHVIDFKVRLRGEDCRIDFAKILANDSLYLD